MAKELINFVFFFKMNVSDTVKEFHIDVQAVDYFDAVKKYYRNPHAVYAHKIVKGRVDPSTKAVTGEVIYDDPKL